MTDLSARLDQLADDVSDARRRGASRVAIRGDDLLALVKVARGADSPGVRYCLSWMREGRLDHDPRAMDMDALLDALAALDVLLAKGDT